VEAPKLTATGLGSGASLLDFGRDLDACRWAQSGLSTAGVQCLLVRGEADVSVSSRQVSFAKECCYEWMELGARRCRWRGNGRKRLVDI
jgi:hypothetical protein